METMFMVAGALGVVLLLTIIVAKAFRQVVHPNEVHIVQSKSEKKSFGNIQTEADGVVEQNPNGNAYFKWPEWIPFIGVTVVELPLSVFAEDLYNYEAYDIGRVPFVVDIKAFFRISDSNTAASRIADFNELKEQLRAILQGSVRSILASSDIEEILEGRGKFGNMFTEEVKDQLPEWGVVTVKNIELMDIRDAEGNEVIANIMAKKESLIEKESRIEVANNIKEAEIAEITATQERDVKAEFAQRVVGEQEAEKIKLIGIANEQAQQEIKEEARATAEKDMAVKKVNDVRSAEIAKDVRVVKAEEQKQVDITETEGIKAQTILRAEGDLVDQQKEGEGILAVGQAEAEAKRLLEMASVEPQIVLATEIGDNDGYQKYLLGIEEISKNETVGVEQAKALQEAGIKVIANTGNVTSGVNNVMDLFTSKGGTSVGASIEAFAQTPAGEKIMSKLGVSVDDVKLLAEGDEGEDFTPNKS